MTTATFAIQLSNEKEAILLDGLTFGDFTISKNDFVHNHCSVLDGFYLDRDDAWDLVVKVHKIAPCAKVYVHLDYLSTGSVEAMCADREENFPYCVQDEEGQLFGLTVGSDEWIELVNQIADEEDGWDDEEDWEDEED